MGDTSVRWASNDIGTEDDAGIFAFERTRRGRGHAVRAGRAQHQRRKIECHRQRDQRDEAQHARRNARRSARPGADHVHGRGRWNAPHDRRADAGEPARSAKSGRFRFLKKRSASPPKNLRSSEMGRFSLASRRAGAGFSSGETPHFFFHTRNECDILAAVLAVSLWRELNNES